MIDSKKLIAGTVATRVFAALASFAIVSVNSKYLFAEGVGTVTIFIMSITLITIFSEIVGGANITFLASRLPFLSVVSIAYPWALMVSFVGVLILFLFHLIPMNYLLPLLIGSFFQSILNFHYHWFTGRNKVSYFNVGMLIYYLLLLFLLIFGYNFEMASPLYFAYAVCLVLFIVLFFTHIKIYFLEKHQISSENWGFKSNTIKQVFRLGIQNQTAAISQFGNYRVVYFIIEILIGRGALGVFSVANQLAEGIWIPGKSLSTIQYGKISNLNNDLQSRKITRQYMALSLLSAVAGSFVLYFLPEGLIEMFFGLEFLELKSLVPYLIPGILAISISMAFSHYFSGIGKPIINMYCSFSGLIFTLIIAYWLVMSRDLIGAAIVLSSVYSFITLMQFFFYIKMKKG